MNFSSLMDETAWDDIVDKPATFPPTVPGLTGELLLNGGGAIATDSTLTWTGTSIRTMNAYKAFITSRVIGATNRATFGAVSNGGTASALFLSTTSDASSSFSIFAGTYILSGSGSGGLSWGAGTIWHSANDGAASGLDADLLDGQHGAYYLDLANSTAPGLDTYVLFNSGGGVGASASLRFDTSGDPTLYLGAYANFFTDTSGVDPVFTINALGNLLTIDTGTGVLGYSGNTVWHSGNDGSGSGLDADFLDGSDGTFYLDRANHSGVQPDTSISLGGSTYEVLYNSGGAITSYSYFTFDDSTLILRVGDAQLAGHDGSLPLGYVGATLLVPDMADSGSYVQLSGDSGSSHTVNFTVQAGSRIFNVGYSGFTINGANILFATPIATINSAYTFTLADANLQFLHPSADTTARTVTVPANASVAFPTGTELEINNQNGAGVITIAITSDTMRLSPGGTTGSRTLAANGRAFLRKLTSTEWIISGTGLT